LYGSDLDPAPAVPETSVRGADADSSSM
jgi:hypothetical protein